MLNLDKAWFESVNFLFLWPETFEYIQKQIEQGYYIDDSVVGYLRPDYSISGMGTSTVTVDGKKYKNGAQALSALKENSDYTLHEVNFGNSVEYKVRRNIKLFDVSCIDDIVSNIGQLKEIHNQEVNACVERDIEFIQLFVKKKRKNYGRYISSFVEKCQLESEEGKKAKKRSKELAKQNSELRIEIKALTQKLKTIEAQGDAKKIKKCAGDAVDTLLKAATLIRETYLSDE